MIVKMEGDDKGNTRSAVAGRIHLALLKFSGLVAFEGGPLNLLLTIVAIGYMHCSLVIVTTMYLSGTITKLMGKKEDIDIQKIAETVGLCGVHARYLLMFIKRAKLAHVLAESRRLWQQLTTDEEKLIRKFVAKSVKLTKLYILVNVAMMLSYLATSQLPLFHSKSKEKFNRTLPYLFYTELDVNSKCFSAVVTVQMVSMMGVCLSSWGVDCTSPFLIMLICGHVRTLCTRFNLLHQSTVKVSEVDIVKCVLYHQNIIAFSKEIEQLLSPVFFVQLLSSTYNIALVGLKLLDDDPDKIKYFTVFIIMLFQLFVCQWAPDLLVTESATLYNSAYFIPESNEHCSNVKETKLIHIVIMRSQHSIQLKAGGVLNLSMETFGSIVKGIVSFFMVLRSFR